MRHFTPLAFVMSGAKRKGGTMLGESFHAQYTAVIND